MASKASRHSAGIADRLMSSGNRFVGRDGESVVKQTRRRSGRIHDANSRIHRSRHLDDPRRRT